MSHIAWDFVMFPVGNVELCKCSSVLNGHLQLGMSVSRHGPNIVSAVSAGIQVESDCT